MNKIESAGYNFSAELREHAKDFCGMRDIDAVHYFVEQARKVDRLLWAINRRYPKNIC